jgi:uncharacterized protein (TIGR03118 family)
VTDDPTENPAQTTDSDLLNPWGVSYSPTGPFWVSDNGSGLATAYSVDPATHATTKLGIEVSILGDGSVTGQVFNDSSVAFHGDPFLFASEDGTISGWRPALGTTAEVLATVTGASYKGSALGTSGGVSYLYSANFAAGTIDVLDGDLVPTTLAGSFTDPNLPAGFAPFNVQNLGGTLFVSYAVVGANGDDVAGLGNGVVDAFDLQGNFVRRITAGGALNSPWGLALAPFSFGSFAGALLVGNFGDGRIHAFDPATGAPLGALTDANGDPIAIDGLWALVPGNGGAGGDAGAVYFSAGPQGETHGLFGAIAVPEPGTLVVLAGGLLGLGWSGRRPTG